MSEFDLKKYIRKKEVSGILNNVADAFSITFAIKDDKGKVILGIEEPNTGNYPVLLESNTIGWVNGDSKAAVIARILEYMANNECEKRALASEVLEKYREVTLLYDSAEKITSSLDLKEVSKRVVDEALRVIEATNASVKVVNKESRIIERIITLDDIEKPEQHSDDFAVITDYVIKSGNAEIINDVKSDPRYRGKNSGINSVICAPLKVNNRVIGAIEFGNKNLVHYKAEDLKLLNTLAIQAATAIENANLYDSLKEAFFQTVQALVETIEKKDMYTAGHARRVAIYSVAIGEEIGLSRTEITRIKLAALLHDIGKIGVEDSILSKNGRLSNEEYAKIKMHPVYGAEIIQNIKQLKDIIMCVRGHHERYDGLGYPDGLKEDDIPLIARIIAVADTFDAMTSDRSYRPAMDIDFALRELSKNVYTQFDPQVVKVFLCLYKSGRIKKI